MSLQVYAFSVFTKPLTKLCQHGECENWDLVQVLDGTGVVVVVVVAVVVGGGGWRGGETVVVVVMIVVVVVVVVVRVVVGGGWDDGSHVMLSPQQSA